MREDTAAACLGKIGFGIQAHDSYWTGVSRTMHWAACRRENPFVTRQIN
jgi:hypothetical protein